MDLEQLEQRFKNIRNEYSSLKALCESKVVRFEWATNSMYELEPFYYERHRVSRGKRLKAEPAEKNGKYQYGFDEQNHPVVQRDYVDFKGRFYEEFLIVADNFIETMRFDYSLEKEPINICRHELDGAKIVSRMSYAGRGCAIETYQYEQDKIVKIETWHKEHDNNKITEITTTIEYDFIGLLKIIEHWKLPNQAEKPYLIYQRPDKKQSVKNLSEIVLRKLVDLIPEAVAKAGIDEESYCLALVYDFESDAPLPPLLGIGLERERQSWIEKYCTEAKDYLWSPPEFTYFDTEGLALNDKELSEACNLLNQEICIKNNFGIVSKLLNETAVELGKTDWSAVIKTTADFIIYAVDLEGVDLKRNLKASVNPDKLSSLKNIKILSNKDKNRGPRT